MSLFTRIRLFLLFITLFSSLASVQASAAGAQYLCNLSRCTRTAAMPFNWSSYTATRYPVVLVHGMLGGHSDFYMISLDLMLNGSQVFQPKVSGLQSTEVRGEQLLKQIQLIRAISGAQRVNLLGHSHGGLTVRYVAGVRPDLVASVTTVGTPNQGSKLVDFGLSLLKTDPTGLAKTALNTIGNLVGTLFDINAGAFYSQEYQSFMQSITSSGVQNFNRRFPAGAANGTCGEGAYSVNGMRFYSWSGTSPSTNFLDPSDIGLIASSLLQSEPNDGLITRCSSHFGQVIRDNYRMNHTDEINQTMGLVSWWEVNPLSVYRAHINRLKNAGL